MALVGVGFGAWGFRANSDGSDLTPCSAESDLGFWWVLPLGHRV